jgi:hypothetical protein
MLPWPYGRGARSVTLTRATRVLPAASRATVTPVTLSRAWVDRYRSTLLQEHPQRERAEQRGPRSDSSRPGANLVTFPARQIALGTLPVRVRTTRIALCPRSAVGSNMHGQPPSITAMPRWRP